MNEQYDANWIHQQIDDEDNFVVIPFKKWSNAVGRREKKIARKEPTFLAAKIFIDGPVKCSLIDSWISTFDLYPQYTKICEPSDFFCRFFFLFIGFRIKH